MTGVLQTIHVSLSRTDISGDTQRRRSLYVTFTNPVKVNRVRVKGPVTRITVPSLLYTDTRKPLMTHIQLLLEKEPEGGRANLYWLLSKRNHFPFGPRIDVS